MIYIVDNGEHYEENRIYFVEAEPGQIEDLIKTRLEKTGKCSYFIIGRTCKIEWCNGSESVALVQFLEDVHWESTVCFEQELRNCEINRDYGPTK